MSAADEQCPWYVPSSDGKRSMRCIRDDGHRGVHRAYNGHWNAETEFRAPTASVPVAPGLPMKPSGDALRDCFVDSKKWAEIARQGPSEARPWYVHDVDVPGARSDCFCSWCENHRRADERRAFKADCSECRTTFYGKAALDDHKCPGQRTKEAESIRRATLAAHNPEAAVAEQRTNDARLPAHLDFSGREWLRCECGAKTNAPELVPLKDCTVFQMHTWNPVPRPDSARVSVDKQLLADLINATDEYVGGNIRELAKVVYRDIKPENVAARELAESFLEEHPFDPEGYTFDASDLARHFAHRTEPARYEAKSDPTDVAWARDFIGRIEGMYEEWAGDGPAPSLSVDYESLMTRLRLARQGPETALVLPKVEAIIAANDALDRIAAVARGNDYCDEYALRQDVEKVSQVLDVVEMAIPLETVGGDT